MAKREDQIQKLLDEKRALEFRLISVDAKIERSTPRSLDDHMEFSRNRAAREGELRSLEAEKDALNQQIRILDQQIAALQQATIPKNAAKQAPKRQIIYAQIETLLAQNPGMKKSEAISRTADELDMTDEAVKKAYYDEAHAIQKGQGRNRDSESKDEPDIDEK